jgi:hypothetical protein
MKQKNKKTEDEFDDFEEDFDLLDEPVKQKSIKKPQEQSNDDIDDDEDDMFKEDFGFDDNSGISDTSPMEKHGDLLKGLTSFDKYIKDKINGWLGLVWSEDAGKYTPDPDILPIMNRKCAKWCVDYLKTYTRENNIITDIGKDDYKDMNEDIIEVLWMNIGTRAEEFKINNNGDILRICVEMEHAAKLVLMGAGDGAYKKMLQESVSWSGQLNPGINNNQNMNNMMGTPKKVGMLSRVKQALGKV